MVLISLNLESYILELVSYLRICLATEKKENQCRNIRLQDFRIHIDLQPAVRKLNNTEVG
jgi:hypothetical protein